MYGNASVDFTRTHLYIYITDGPSWAAIRRCTLWIDIILFLVTSDPTGYMKMMQFLDIFTYFFGLVCG